MLVDEIKQTAKNKHVNLFFDMDGTVVEYETGKTGAILKNVAGVYLNARPLKSVLKQVKSLSKNKNITIYIVSHCHYTEQMQEKLVWLKRYMPYIVEENIKITVLTQTKFTKETKPYLKANYIKTIMDKQPDSVNYLIEDDVPIIRASMKALPELKVVHVSTFVK